jgi:hypothetical protein
MHNFKGIEDDRYILRTHNWPRISSIYLKSHFHPMTVQSHHAPPFAFYPRDSTPLCRSRRDRQCKFTALCVDPETRVFKVSYEPGIGEKASLLFDSWDLVDVDTTPMSH